MNKRILIPLAVSLAAISMQQAHAGGLWLNEFGAPAMGRAGAGAEAGTGDASAALYSPASMAQIKNTQLMVTGGLLSSSSKFSVESSGVLNGTGNGGDAGDDIPTGSMFYVKPINDQWQFGFSFAALAGAGLDYDNNWAGRYQATLVDLVAMVAMPSIAYSITDKLSVGFGLPIMYTELEMKLAVPRPSNSDGQAKIDGDDTLVGYHLSLWYEFSETTHFGMYYQSEFDAEYGGDAEITPSGLSVGSDLDLNLAAKAYAGLSHQFSDALTGHITLGWEDWSTMDNVNLSTQTGTSIDLPRNWDDTYHYAVGIEYRLAPEWILNAGYAYDTNPVDAQDRTADLPIDRQNRYALGIQHTSATSFDWGAQLVYADLGSAKINTQSIAGGPLTGYSGEYKDNEIIFLSFSANWTL
ncbi:MAG: outer membrane protein transport protein [Gammaproteobacteria bacterium]|nr:outer membrane protein transport protein [Gammaproteobacteria bacterium]MBQ0838867.1 outer membrane protein transport protein [Gammaproteobacteria bacterium]